jgi:hypothetical protein
MLTEVQRDPAYLIIKEWIPSDFQAELFEHTRKLKAEEDGGFTANLRDGKKYFVRRRGNRRGSGAKMSQADTWGQTAPLRRRRFAGTGRIRRTDSEDSEVRVIDQATSDKQFSGRSTTIEARQSLDRESLSSSKNRGLDPAHEQRSSHDEARKPEGHDHGADAGVPDIIVTSDDFSHESSEQREASSDRSDSRMKAMETMLLYRAMLFACLLATGTDTSDLLWLENRTRVVQVL